MTHAVGFEDLTQPRADEPVVAALADHDVQRAEVQSRVDRPSRCVWFVSEPGGPS